MKYQITTNLVAEINDAISDTTDVALVYDRIGCWLYNGEMLVCLRENSQINEQRASFEDAQNVFSLDQLELANMNVCSSLGYVSANNSRASVLLSCNVPYVHQTYDKTCWAATITCILRYTGNQTVTEEDVIRQQYGVLRNRGITPDEAQALFRSYGLAYTHRTAPTSGDTFIRNLQNEYPIYASFYVAGTVNQGHACTIYLYHIMSCYMQVMDPEYGGVHVPCPPSGQQYTYVSPYSNSTLVLSSIVSMYE